MGNSSRHMRWWDLCYVSMRWEPGQVLPCPFYTSGSRNARTNHERYGSGQRRRHKESYGRRTVGGMEECVLHEQKRVPSRLPPERYGTREGRSDGIHSSCRRHHVRARSRFVSNTYAVLCSIFVFCSVN